MFMRRIEFEADAPVVTYNQGDPMVFEILAHTMQQREANEVQAAHQRILEKEENREVEL